MKLFEDTFSYLEKGMKVRSLQQRIIAANIANIDTPHYKAKRLDFNKTLNNFLNNEVSNNGQEPKPIIYEDKKTVPGNDFNNVSLETEIVNLQKVAFHYQAMSKLLKNKFKIMKDIITEENK